MSNYEWQKQYSRQQIDNRLREAEAHRLAKSAAASRPGSHPLATVFRTLIGLFPARRAHRPRLFHSEEHV